jgi:lipoprotein LprG
VRPKPYTLLAAAAAVALGACGSTAAPKLSASELLAKAEQTVNATNSLHFVLTSSNVSSSGTNLVGGSGDLERPASLQGSFQVTISGFTATVKVAAVGTVFEAELPLSSSFSKTNPAEFGLENPASLLSPSTGLISLLNLGSGATVANQERVDGELLDTISYQIPGKDVPVLPDQNPSKPVDMTVAIDPSNFQLRSVTLVGPLTSATSNSTYVVTLSDYGEHVTLTLPPTS